MTVYFVGIDECSKAKFFALVSEYFFKRPE